MYRKTILTAAISMALGLPQLAGAEDAESLDTLRVLGQGSEGFNVAITDELVAARQAVDLEDLFSHEPSITVGGGSPVAQKIYVRGLEDTLLNVTIDGATQAGYLYHHQGRVFIEPELIKDVVIKAGAGNAADGAGALGGAIHFNLKDAKDMLRPGERAGALFKTAYHTNNQGWKNHVSGYGMLTDDFGVLVSYSHFKSADDIEDGRGNHVDSTEQEREDIRIKLSGNIAPDHYVSLSYEDYEDEGRRYARGNMVGTFFHPVYPNPLTDQKTNRKSVIGNYGYNPANELIDLSATVYYNDGEIEKRGDVWATAFPPPGFVYGDVYNGQWHGGGVESYGLNLSNTSLLGNHELEYGYEHRSDEADLINELAPPFNEEETEINAFFLQATLQVTDFGRLSAGARLDDYEYTDNYGVDIDDSRLSPNATLFWDVTDSLELSVGYAKAFKGVSSPEVFFLENGTFGLGTTLASYTGANTTIGGFGAGALTAEESDNFEIGFRYDGGRFKASGEIYKQTIENAQFIDGGTWTRYSYTDEVKVKGYALRMAYYWNHVSLNAGVAHSRPRLGNEPLSSGDMGLGTAYGRTWTLGVDYDFNEDISLGWDSRFVERLEYVRAGQDDKAGYGVHDIYAQYAPNDALTLGVAVNNLFDKFYYDQGTFYTTGTGATPLGIPEPGRDVRLYLSYQF